MKQLVPILFFLLAVHPAAIYAQQKPRVPAVTLDALKHKDLSFLWVGPLPDLQNIDTTKLEWFDRWDPLGYIGKNYQRFDIHIRSICRSSTDSLRYELTGFTRTGDNICRFQGELHLDSITYSAPNYPDTDRWGSIYGGWRLIGTYTLREDLGQHGAGVLEGRHTIDIATDSLGNIYYDTMFMVADGYSTNQWAGTWRCYETKAVKPCNWGDARIPDSEGPYGLDVGAGYFLPDDKYLRNGWQSYIDAERWDDDETRAEARREESRRWWLFEW